MSDINPQRSDYTSSLDQLMTISCILAGFAFSGLISLPGIESEMFQKIVDYFHGDLNRAFYLSFYSLFFSTICFLSTIMSVLVYKVNNYTVPTRKLKRVYLVTNILFSFAIAALMTSVISFGVPNFLGIILASIMGLGVAACFVWENMVPMQKRIREQQLQEEKSAAAKAEQKKS